MPVWTHTTWTRTNATDIVAGKKAGAGAVAAELNNLGVRVNDIGEEVADHAATIGDAEDLGGRLTVLEAMSYIDWNDQADDDTDAISLYSTSNSVIVMDSSNDTSLVTVTVDTPVGQTAGRCHLLKCQTSLGACIDFGATTKMVDPPTSAMHLDNTLRYLTNGDSILLWIDNTSGAPLWNHEFFPADPAHRILFYDNSTIANLVSGIVDPSIRRYVIDASSFAANQDLVLPADASGVLKCIYNRPISFMIMNMGATYHFKLSAAAGQAIIVNGVNGTELELQSLSEITLVALDDSGTTRWMATGDTRHMSFRDLDTAGNRPASSADALGVSGEILFNSATGYMYIKSGSTWYRSAAVFDGSWP